MLYRVTGGNVRLFFLWLWAAMLWGVQSYVEAAPAAAPEQCIADAANYHGVHPGVLRAILRVESGFKENAVNRNTNGTLDVGIGQINSMHFKELARYGVTPEHLMQACTATYVSAWFLRRQVERYGNTWQGIATYHSATQQHNTRYAHLIYQELVREGWIAKDPSYRPYTRAHASTSDKKHSKFYSQKRSSSTQVARAHSPLVIDVGE